MSYTAGPIALTAGVPIVLNNPGANSGNLRSQAAVIVNLSTYELVVSSGSGATTAVIDPMTRDLVPLDAEAGQQITIDPLVIGTLVQPTTLSECFVTWYQAGENVPGAYPTAITAGLGPYSAQVALNAPIAGGSNEIFSLSGQPAVFRSAAITIFNLTATAQTVLISVQTGISITTLVTYKVVLGAALDTAFVRIPLTPVDGLTTMNESLEVSTPTGNIGVTILLDTVECATPPIVTYGEQAIGEPSGPTAAVQITASGGALAAPASGTWRLFGLDVQATVATGAFSLTDAVTTDELAFVQPPAANTTLHVDLSGYRCAGAVTAGVSSCVGYLRYALGP